MTLTVLQAASSALNAAIFLVVPLTFGYVLYKRRDFPFRAAFTGLSVFLTARGVCSLLQLISFWDPLPWTTALLNLYVGIAGAILAALLLRKLPDLLRYPTPEAIRRTNETLDATLRKVTELERQKIEAQFMANMSHDLRTPIAAIRGYSETLLNGGLDDPENRTEFVRIIQRNGERIGSLVENLLALTTVDAAQTKRLAVDIELASFVDDLLADMRPSARRKRVELINEVGADLSVCAQDQQLWQILQNLAGNAIKFTPREGTIRVSARPLGASVEISVADTGPGIHPDQLPLLFDRFHSRRQGKPIEKGSGLGLSIVKALVEAHGGAVAVDTHPGMGSTFRFTLPAALPVPAPAAPPPAPAFERI